MFVVCPTCGGQGGGYDGDADATFIDCPDCLGRGSVRSERMDERGATMRIGSSSTVLARRPFYLPTYFEEKPGNVVTLLYRDAALIRGPSGREFIRAETVAKRFRDTDEMVAWIEETDAVEAPEADGNPRWKPTREQLVG